MPAMGYHSDDISTDLSSSLSSPLRNELLRRRTETSSSQVERLEESDKQILEWAGKLEIESVDLREKSSELIKVLQNNSKELCGLMKRLIEAPVKDGEVKELGISLKEIGSRLETQLNDLAAKMTPQPSCTVNPLKEQEKETDLISLATKVKDHFDITQQKTDNSFVAAQGLLFSISKQLEDTQNVLLSMSRDISLLCDRQSHMEKCLNSFEYREKSEENCVSATSDLGLHGSTLLSETEEEGKDISGPTTGSINRINVDIARSYHTSTLTAKRIEKRRNLGHARTIIPWEEIDRCTTEMWEQDGQL